MRPVYPRRILDELDLRPPHEVFRDLLSRTAAALDGATYVEEWLGPRQRLPVFDVQVLRDFVGNHHNTERLVALLTSYLRVRSGSVWQRSGGRWRRRKFSELNPVDLAEMGALARLGDLALFLSGVFPEYVANHPLEPRQLSRLSSVLGGAPGELARAREPFWTLEWVGRLAYARAGESRLADDFRVARRILNLLTGRYLYPLRDRWFGPPAGL